MGIYELLNWTGGWALCKVSGAVPAAFLNRCAAEGVELSSSAAEGELALRVRLRGRDLRKAQRIAAAAQCSLELLDAGGAAALGRSLLRRWFAVLGLTAALAVLFWSRLYIWELSVSGNETVSTGRILDGLRVCGVTYGSFWPGITSDNLRSELLSVVPELSWATVNIHGSRAEVIVRERVPVPELWNGDQAVNITAKKTGFVTQVRALNGVALVKPGSAVVQGEVLISCQTEGGFGGVRIVHATGSVEAETGYERSAVVPRSVLAKRYTGSQKARWALDFGKARHYFFQNSSISEESCDKITEAWEFGLGGVFRFPVRLVRETYREYQLEEREREKAPALLQLEQILHARLLAELAPGGEILQERYSASEDGERITVCLRAGCREEIGVETPADTDG